MELGPSLVLLQAWRALGLDEYLRERERDLFNPDRTILLHDLTNSSLPGTAARSNGIATGHCTDATTCAAH